MTARSTTGQDTKSIRPSRPTIYLLGPQEHPDFAEVVAELHRDGDVFDASKRTSPELVVLLVERPGAIGDQDVAALRSKWPLAGFVAVAGSWCEGELRTGQPLTGMPRIYWYAFPPWWRRQLDRRAQGLCPAWSDVRVDDHDALPRIIDSYAAKGPRSPSGSAEFRTSSGQHALIRRADINKTSNREPSNTETGLIVLSTPRWETAETLSDTLLPAGYATIWSPPGRGIDTIVLRGVVAGIWDGGQLDEREAAELNRFAQFLARQTSPTIALLDFPRWEDRTRALAAGAADVLGKPWLAVDLLSAIDHAVHGKMSTRTALTITRAA